ncbi:hypothetical protein JQC67_18445 [Aurantibacter crassamenti]|uniref:hypothetical protein n=1 Tax=Aurantibacter crassamenti TaxID=1837375 RepID=UPI001939D4A0|nr:hypothetical protein [Aurantibacter crassamenti]MBM1108138.1 hypothetical protein [Aurantibacter crassamenti]
MRKVNVFLTSCLAIAALSCSKDDAKELASDPDPDGVNAQEEVLLDVNAVSNGVTIDGATKKQGSPVPNGDIEFSLDYKKQTAFQKNGFNIEFKAPEGFAGAYVQLKDENGMADTYFDIPASATTGVSNKAPKTIERGFFANKNAAKGSLASKGEDTSIDVNFEAAVSAGTFCYIICVYDGQGFVSQPSEVCVTVESWGGNVNLVADWEFTKEVDNGETINVGEEYCDDYDYTRNLDCNSGVTKEVTVDYCYTTDGLEITFKSDGSYSYVSDDTDKDVDWDASEASCELVYVEENSSYSSKGNWAYDEEQSRLTLVEFEYTDTYDGQTENGVEEDGYLIFDGKITLTADNLVITETDTYEGEEEVYQYHFNKK